LSVIAITNHKGGVGKTTLTYSLAYEYALGGYSVLLVDLDPSGNLTIAMDQDPYEDGEINLATIISEGESFDPNRLKRSVTKGFATIDILPSNDELYRVESMGNGIQSLFSLKDYLNETGLHSSYDFIFIDTPPNLGILTNIALVTSDFFLVPVSPGKYALKGLDRMFRVATMVKKRINRSLEFLGIVINNFRKHEQPSRALEKSVIDLYGNAYITPPIRRTVDVQKSEIISEPIQLAFPNSLAVRDLKRLSQGVLKRVKKQEI